MKIIRYSKRRNREKLCYACGAVLKVAPDDAYEVTNDFNDVVYYVDCPNCHNQVFLGYDFDDVFPWDYRRV